MEYLKIVLRSDLCMGNGESVGNAVDTDVCMDRAGLPYIPARRLKGCLKQAAFDLDKMGYSKATEKNRNLLFGDAYGNEGCLFIQDAVMKGAETLQRFLTKGVLENDRGIHTGLEGEIPAAVKRSAHSANVERMFTSVRGQTKLQDGVKVDDTLRFTRVVNHYDPFDLENKAEMEFYAPIYLDTDNLELRKFLDSCCKATRHIGSSRNRGLGNVRISICGDNSDSEGPSRLAENEKILDQLQPLDCVTISYYVSLDAPVTLPGCGELNTAIPARSVIGCLARNYLHRGGTVDETFRSLFLNGKVRWSALTPVINGVISDPAPMMLVKLKNDNGRMINHLLENDTQWKHKKPKTMDDAFVSISTPSKEDGAEYLIAEPSIHTIYHNALNTTVQDQVSSGEGGTRTLYMQDSIDAGMIYGGTVSCTAAMAREVLQCLNQSELRFGRSRSAQYAACSLKGSPIVGKCTEEVIHTKEGELIYIVLKSDLAVQDSGRYVTDVEEIRRILAEKLGVSSAIPQGQQDYCRYHVIGGYQSSWQLQKPQIPVVRAGSVYCFEASGQDLPASIQVGQFPQEGFGVCNIMTRETMLNVSKVSGHIDRIEPEKDENRIKDVYTKLLVESGIEAMKQYALDFKFTQEDLPIGRLRLMLSQAKDYRDLLRMIGTIKESDISSEKEVSRKKISENLVKDLYSTVGNADLSLEKMLALEDGLWEEIQHDLRAKELLLKKWKVPMEIILYKHHYERER